VAFWTRGTEQPTGQWNVKVRCWPSTVEELTESADETGASVVGDAREDDGGTPSPLPPFAASVPSLPQAAVTMRSAQIGARKRFAGPP
jgi:hypothetical protein